VFSAQLVAPEQNLLVFTAAVVGGLGSLVGAVLGAVFLQGGGWFLPTELQLLVTGAGVLVVLLVLPGGLGGLVFRWRDLWLRSVARRSGIVSASLLADTGGDIAVPGSPSELGGTGVAPAPPDDGDGPLDVPSLNGGSS
jgi:branched-chain amino acid transport system permease protein